MPDHHRPHRHHHTRHHQLILEYELEQGGVALLAADEPISHDPTPGRKTKKRATATLTRRVKQAIAEWYVLQMLELAWNGFHEHTEQGWNVGRPPYGYQAERCPHPVPAQRAQGKTKTRLQTDPVTGPVVTRIFQLRALDRLGYDDIADRLNTDLDRNPPPMPVDPRRAVGRWTGSAVRGVLSNPKYTGYMVWNRRASKQGGHYNPMNEWVWSPQPTHEPLVTHELFEAASPVARHRQGSRAAVGPNRHPQTKRSYMMRSFIACDLCDRRKFGKTRKGWAYYACQPQRQHHKGRRDWYDDHPKSIWVREDALLEAVHDFFAQRIFGQRRQQYLRARLAETIDAPVESLADAHKTKLAAEITDLQRRQDNLLVQLEEYEPTGETDIDREYRAGIQRRFAELVTRRREAQARLAQLTTRAQPPGDDIALLGEIPQLPPQTGRAARGTATSAL
ncbi:recombinase family protein [Spirillospora sp. CA-128828]|uniref:recombinase family protein n=1 Tax=Spirillospora sp. CA-128828 TaxID=3240033 RepID=UPI003D89FA17